MNGTLLASALSAIATFAIGCGGELGELEPYIVSCTLDTVRSADALTVAFSLGTGSGAPQPSALSDVIVYLTDASEWYQKSLTVYHSLDEQGKSTSNDKVTAATITRKIDESKAALAKLKDANGDYLWAPPATPGGRATIMNFPVAEAEDVPDIGANSYSIAFGDFSRGYLIVDRLGVRVLRDPYSQKPYVLFYTTKRVGGGVQDFDAIKLIKFGTA